MPRLALVSIVLALGFSNGVFGQSPVSFDTRRVFACTEVKPPQQADVGRKVIVVSIPISANFTGDESEERALSAAPVPVSTDADRLVTSIGLTLNRIPAGNFDMGALPEETDADADERPQHRVTISRPFFIGVCEVTQHEYKQVMGRNPSKFQHSDQQPVEQVSWLDAVEFCNKLSKREGRKPYYRIDGENVTVAGGNGFRLPTEAEWEYACRAGSRTKFPFGADLENHAWFEKNSGGKTHAVGQKRANRFGLYDMMGNVWEWCGDRYDADYYKTSPGADPAGVSSASRRVVRGGGWNSSAGYCRPADRSRGSPGFRDVSRGFRVAAVQE